MGPKRLVIKIHSSVKGRRRFKVRGLHRSDEMKSWIELYLRQDKKVVSVEVNVLTSHVLVVFDPDCNPKRIENLLEQVVWAFLRSLSQTTPDENVIYLFEKQLKQSGLLLTSKPLEYEWHIMDAEEVLKIVGSSVEYGLSETASQTSLQTYGSNLIPEPPSRSKFDIFISQFESFPIVVLGAAAGLSVVTGGAVDALVIGSVIVINSIIGYITESEAEKTMNSLKSLVTPSAKVLRDRTLCDLPTQQVLIGDILILKPGVYVSADARVIESSNLTIDESVLTGESLPAEKSAEIIKDPTTPLADRTNMVFAGTIVTGGQGIAVVIAIGRHTELGKIQRLLIETEPQDTIVERQLATIGNQLIIISGTLCGLIFLMGLLRGNGAYLMLRTAISLAVAAVPEGLPAIATATLAIGVQKLRQQRVLVRNLEAVCTLGSVQTVCLDKTGTVTCNKMTVLRIFAGMKRLDLENDCSNILDNINILDAHELVQLMSACVLCNETEVNGNGSKYILNGSSTENALILMAIKYGLDSDNIRTTYPLLEVNYRSEDCPYMSTIHKLDKRAKLLALKGSPVEVLEKCNYYMKDGLRLPLTESDRNFILQENTDMANEALRVLGVAIATKNKAKFSITGGYTWLGLVGMTDPIRKGVKDTLRVFHKAGIETVMITGDQSHTAQAVGQALDIGYGKPVTVLEAGDFNDLQPKALESLCKNINVFSRVSPSDKLQIVQALQSTGKVVAMTGDGINDSPALKAADIGIAMGKSGTDVAREVADVVLQDDELQTLVVAIRDGRAIYDNIRKALRYMLATNFSEILVMFIAGISGIGYPLAAMQLLWINLVSDTFPGLALAMEPPEPGVLTRPPRDPEEPLVRKSDLKRLGFEGTVMSVATLATYGYGLMTYGPGVAAGTLAFHTLTSAQILHALSSRSETTTIFDRSAPAPNKYLTLAVVGSLGIQVLTHFIPGLRSFLGISKLSLSDALVVGGATLGSLFANEITKTSAVSENVIDLQKGQDYKQDWKNWLNGEKVWFDEEEKPSG